LAQSSFRGSSSIRARSPVGDGASARAREDLARRGGGLAAQVIVDPNVRFE